MEPLEQEALEAGSAREAHDHLLALWRQRPADRLAETIEWLTLSLGAARPPIETEVAWFQAAKAQDPIDLPRMMSRPLSSNGKRAVARLRALVGWPSHPWLARGLGDWFSHLQDTAHKSSHELQELLLQLIEKSGDSRLIVRLQQRIAPKPGGRWVWNPQRLERSIAAMRRQGSSWTPDEACLQALSQVELRFATNIKQRTEKARDIQRAAYEPADEAARLVWADWLSERADPRGEFINLQIKRVQQGLSEAEARRERALLSTHHRAWLGPLAPLVQQQSVVFERGMPTEIVVAWSDEQQLLESLDAIEWRTIRSITMPESPRVFMLQRLLPALIFHPNLVALEVVHGIKVGELEALARSKSVGRLRAMNWDVEIGAKRLRSILDGLKGWPRLEQLGLGSLKSSYIAGLSSGALAIGLKSIRAPIDPERGAALYRKALLGFRRSLRTLTIVERPRPVSNPAGWHLVFSMDAEHRRSTVRVHLVNPEWGAPVHTDPLGRLVAILGQLPAELLRLVEVELPAGGRPTAHLEQALERFARQGCEVRL